MDLTDRAFTEQMGGKCCSARGAKPQSQSLSEKMGTAVAADPRRQTMAENAMRGAVVLEAAQLKADEDAENRYTEAAWLKAEQDAAAAARVQEVHLAK